VEIAKEAGFAISAEELKKSQAEMTEISDDELEGVAAGGIFDSLNCSLSDCGYGLQAGAGWW
jgi:hypothetical protein